MGEADHYRTLGLRRDASKAEVKAAFSRLALLHHPDRHAKADAATRADATRRFRQVYDAYHVLYDDSRRAEYDLRTSLAWSGFGQHGAKSRSSSASGGYGHGGASSSHSGRYRYRHGRGGDFQDWSSPNPREGESLGVWMRANWYPLLCCTLRVAEVVIDGWKLYNTWKS
ncbi:chaperone protein dnaJ 72-like [Hordeum vulgare subsp. vulgare]|uniref:J domain-containing protein n=1 Tax=Hordeum vulgare subsp. vulgare TaxID=112509 RepID=A0A8I6XMD2_HORVV|nr:chaperone protein dnaJ 72-like [Hordeum vulgare subsp. vulgare]